MSIEMVDATPQTIDLGTTINTSEPTTPPAPENAGPKTFTEEDVKLMLQKEADRRVTPVSKQLQETRRELEELRKASMTESQRKQYEYEQKQLSYQEELNNTKQTLAQYVTLAELNKRGWDESLMPFLLSEDDSSVKSKADALQKLIEVEVAKVRNASVKSSSIKPPTQSSSTTSVEGVEDFDPTDPKSLMRFADSVKQGRASLSQ